VRSKRAVGASSLKRPSIYPCDGVKQLAVAIARWVAANTASESIFLTPIPSHGVDAHALLDFIARETGIDQDSLGREVASAQAHQQRK
jgi:hypothetical protein